MSDECTCQEHRQIGINSWQPCDRPATHVKKWSGPGYAHEMPVCRMHAAAARRDRTMGYEVVALEESC